MYFVDSCPHKDDMQTQVNSTRELNITPMGESRLAEIRQEITGKLHVKKFKSSGFSSRNIPCPFHKDTEPSASLHVEKGLYCHAEAQWFTWKELAKELGVKWSFPRTGKQIHRQLTDEVIQKLVGKRRVKACQVLSKLYAEGQEGHVVSIPDIVAMTNCSNATVTRMVKDELFSQIPTTYNYKEVGKYEKNSKRGRKSKFVRVPTLPELEEMLDCDGSKRHYTLEVSDDNMELRAEVSSLPIKRAPNKTKQVSAKYLMEAAGVKCPKTIRKYMKMVTDITEDSKSHPLSIAELATMPQTRQEYKTTRKQGSGWTWLEVRGVPYAYNKEQALALFQDRIVDRIEDIIVNTRKANIYHYTGMNPELPRDIAELVDALKDALIVRKAETEKSEWNMLMDDMDETIRQQQERELRWAEEGMFTFKQAVLVAA